MDQGNQDKASQLLKIIEDIIEVKTESILEKNRNQNNNNNVPFWNLETVCKMTGLSRSTIYTYVNEKKIPYYKPTGKNLFFKPEDIKNFIMDERNYYKSKEMLQKDAETIYMLDRI